MALTLQDINAYTNKLIVPKSTDVIFKNDPLLARIMSKQRMEFRGGTLIQRPIMYAELASGFFSRGDTFDTAYRYTDTAFNVNMKFAYSNITLLGVDDVLNAGPEAAFSIVETKMANAAATVSKLLSTKMYLDGQGVLSDSTCFDGLAAWIDDGSTNATYSSASNITRSFASVGGITRADIQAGPSTGDETAYSQVNGINSYTNRNLATFTLADINKAYSMAWFGSDSPDLMVVTNGGWNKIWNATTPLQRYQNKDNDLAKVGFQSFKFNEADVVISKYMQDAIGSTYGMILGLNTDYLEFYLSTNKKFQFGFTGFKEAQNTIDASGQYLVSGNLVVSNPRSSFKIVGTSIVN